MFKSLKGLAVPFEKRLRAELIKELAQLEKLVDDGVILESGDDVNSELAVRFLASGGRVYCPNRQNPLHNRKHHVRSLLIH